MDYKKYEYENYTVHFIKTDKFKSTMISLILVNEFDKESLTKNALLRRLLTRSNKNYKTETEMIKKIYSLYNSSLYIENILHNNVVTTDFSIEFLNEKYTEKGFTNKILDYYFDVIFNPNIIDNKFEMKNFSIAKKSLIDYYDREKDDKNLYATKRAYELLSLEHLRYSSNGYKECLDTTSEKNMYDYYINLFKTANSNIFVIGSFDENKMLEIINLNVKNKLYKNENKYVSNNFYSHESIKEKIEKENNNQSKLVMLYKTINITERERNVIFPIFNRIFGVGNNSKLFRNVREKSSLAYDIRSSISRDDGILTVIAGITGKDKDKVVNKIKYELKNIIKGNFSDEDIKDAIISRKRILTELLDENSTILYSKIDNVLFGNDDIKERIEKTSAVTKEEIISLSKKLELSVIYMLEGEKHE